eukprot:759911-Hanusia_phi.AAC.7
MQDLGYCICVLPEDNVGPWHKVVQVDAPAFDGEKYPGTFRNFSSHFTIPVIPANASLVMCMLSSLSLLDTSSLPGPPQDSNNRGSTNLPHEEPEQVRTARALTYISSRLPRDRLDYIKTFGADPELVQENPDYKEQTSAFTRLHRHMAPAKEDVRCSGPVDFRS